METAFEEWLKTKNIDINDHQVELFKEAWNTALMLASDCFVGIIGLNYNVINVEEIFKAK